ncbi:MAG: zinc ABC transporter substrate-binding protein [Calditrichaeota bacterium]|nr:zinc ABC transporter substrate-binding protein [Calditrichota bacterium]MCB9368553.1 zinc ABC transporter substrate-binding protein [Calditrichota bacterium]
MKTTGMIAAVLVCLSHSFAALTVGASLPDFASIASYVGGDRVETFSIARSKSDPHSVEVLPTYMVRVSRADLYLKVGLGLDQWADQIIEGARNSKLKIVDCSAGVSVLEKPTGKVDASMGDVHPDGNPHYWLAPENGVAIAQTIANALSALDPDHAELFSANVEKLRSEIAAKLPSWQEIADHIPNHEFVSYHSSWSYFAEAFDLKIAEKIEPVPGIPPTARHLANLVNVIESEGVKVVVQEPYFSDDGAKYLARETGVTVLKLAPSCEDADASSYLSHFDQIFSAFETVPAK